MKKKILIIIGVIVLLLGVLGVLYFKKYNTDEYEHVGFFPTTKLRPIWERKIKNSQEIKFGIITDTHVHAKRIHREDESPGAVRYLKEKSLRPLEEFVEDMKKFKPEFVLHLGDVIEGTGDENFVGQAGVRLVREQLEKIETPVFWSLGNHDLKSVTKDEFKEVLDLSSLNQVIDSGDYRFIVLDGNFKPNGEDTYPGSGYVPGFLVDKTFEWLEPKLQTNKQVIVFMHFSSTVYDNSTKSVVGNGERLRKMLGKYKVVAIFNGHIEDRAKDDIGGVKYFSLPGTKKNEKYKRCFYEVYLKGRDVKVKMFYVDSITGEYKQEWL